MPNMGGRFDSTRLSTILLHTKTINEVGSMNIVHKFLASVGIGKIVADVPNYCCRPLELPVDPRLRVITDLEEAKKEMKRLCIRHLFELGDRIPADERFTITMDVADVEKYQAWVMTLCLEKIMEWRIAQLQN